MTKLLHKHLFFHNDPSDLKYYLGPGFWDSHILRLHCKLTPWTHGTHDTWHLTCDRWWGVNILSKCQLSSFHGLGVMMFWMFGCRKKMLSPDLQKICESNEWFKHLPGIPVSGLLSDTGQPGRSVRFSLWDPWLLSVAALSAPCFESLFWCRATQPGRFKYIARSILSHF